MCGKTWGWAPEARVSKIRVEKGEKGRTTVSQLMVVGVKETFKRS